MRPRSVILGEQLYAGSIVLTIVLSAIGWEQTVAAGGLLLAIGVNAFVIGLSALLLILTTRRGSRVALGFLAALTVVNLIGYLIQIGSGVVASGWFGVITTVQTLLSVVAVVLLFRPNARAWFRRMSHRSDYADGEIGA